MNEAELLFTQVLNCDRASLYTNKDLALDAHKTALVSAALKRRILGEPLQYILGKAEFMGFEFKVSPDVLIPRPETEILVEAVVNLVRSCRTTGPDILDLGTGSGCIAVSLAKFLSEAKVTAVDVSQKALEIAKHNATLNSAKVNFILGDLFKTYELRLTTYDFIISNPPYIISSEINKLQPEVKFEPRIALDGGADGLVFYRRIINDSSNFLKEHGFLVMEMGFGQREMVERLLVESRKFRIIEIVKDYSGIDRVIIGKKS